MSIKSHKVVHSVGKVKYTETQYTMKDPAKWNAFVKKWHISERAGYGGLIGPIQSLLEDLSQLSPIPKIQQLCLLDLPVELLDRIFSLASVENARLLSSVCHKLRAIGKPYIFVTRTLKLDFPLDFWAKVKDKGRGQIAQLMVTAIKPYRINLIKQAKILLGRPDLLNVVGSLVLGNSALSTLEHFEADALVDENFHEPVWKVFKNVICSCRNLRSLSLTTRIHLSAEILQAIVSLPHLVELDILGCLISNHVIQKIFSGDIKPSHSVLNLDLLDSTPPTYEIWGLVACFPNLRTLSVVHMGLDPLEPSIMVSRGRSKVFASLERLNIGPATNAEIIDLTRWIELNSAEAPLKLTHLRISALTGLDERFIFEFLDALETAPLQVLVLDGINEGSYELFDRIAAKCHHLIGLTVIRRENILQKQRKLATWPHASWEYAPHFSAFKRLEHFTWNFRVDYFDQTPAGMRYFEGGFITDTDIFQRRMKGDDVESEDYFLDSHYLAYPFAAHCKTLKSFAIDSERLLETFCYIKRLANNQIELQPVDRLRGGNMDILDKWDIRDFSLHWPHIIPNSNKKL